ncbi:MAG: hypothetical protein HZB68_04880 [Candidatus Aenigmarchaeota archaeon]|nr:hypothetical protein [Candidatus Aenigmarchaeota archaeon]
MRKLEFVEIPYVGVEFRGQGLKFGFKELIKPDSEIIFYSTSLKEDAVKEYIGNEKTLNTIMTSYDAFCGGYFGILSSFNPITAAPAAAFFGALTWREAGKRRSFNNALRKLSPESIVDVDSSSLLEIGVSEKLEEKIQKYYDLAQEREDSFGSGAKGWFKRNFSKYESDEMMNYRLDEIYPVFEKLEKNSRDKWNETGKKEFYYISEGYGRVNERLSFRGRHEQKPI